MPFRFVYRTADISALTCSLDSSEIYISWSLHKCEWHSHTHFLHALYSIFKCIRIYQWKGPRMNLYPFAFFAHLLLFFSFFFPKPFFIWLGLINVENTVEMWKNEKSVEKEQKKYTFLWCPSQIINNVFQLKNISSCISFLINS